MENTYFSVAVEQIKKNSAALTLNRAPVTRYHIVITQSHSSLSPIEKIFYDLLSGFFKKPAVQQLEKNSTVHYIKDLSENEIKNGMNGLRTFDCHAFCAEKQGISEKDYNTLIVLMSELTYQIDSQLRRHPIELSALEQPTLFR